MLCAAQWKTFSVVSLGTVCFNRGYLMVVRNGALKTGRGNWIPKQNVIVPARYMECILHVKNCKHGDDANSEVEKRSSDYTVTTVIKNLFMKWNKKTYISLALNISGQRNNSSKVPFLTLCHFVESKKRLALQGTWLNWHPEASVQFPKQCSAHLFKTTRSKW